MWQVSWLDESGRCVEGRWFSRTTGGRLFFVHRCVLSYGEDGSLLRDTQWTWDRYGRIEREETDVAGGVTTRLVWHGRRDKKGQIEGQFILAPRKPDLSLLSVPMGDEPAAATDAFVMEIDDPRPLAFERRRQAFLAEARRRGADAKRMFDLESLATGGPIFAKAEPELLSILTGESD